MTTALAAAAQAQPADPAPDPSAAELARQVEELRAQVRALEERIEKLEGGGAAEVDADAPGLMERGADREALAKIELPANPTREQVAAYVDAIEKATRGQNSFSSRDPQVEMLARVGPEHLDVLVERLGSRRGLFGWGGGGDELRFYLIPAIDSLVEERHKPLILEALPRHHQLVEVVVSQGWEEDARDVLIAELRKRPHFLPTEWIDAVATLDDPETYDLLKDYFIRGSNQAHTYQAIRHLPDIDLDKAVRDAWRRASRQRGSWERLRMAAIAAEHGHLDALEALVESLDDEVHWGWRESNRDAVERLIDFTGTDEEIQRWFRENKARLKFDPPSRMFLLEDLGPEAEPAPATQGAR